MLRQINIELIDKIRKPFEGNRFLNGLFSVLTILLFPIVIVTSLVYLFVILTFGLLRNLISSKNADQELNSPETESINNNWTLWTSTNSLKLYQKFKGDIRFGPTYHSLKSEPEIIDLNGEIYGDWFFQIENGILIQQWNLTDTPNTNLILIDTESYKTRTLKEQIPSVLWNIVETENQTLQLECDTGKEILTYKIEIKNGS